MLSQPDYLQRRFHNILRKNMIQLLLSLFFIYELVSEMNKVFLEFSYDINLINQYDFSKKKF